MRLPRILLAAVAAAGFVLPMSPLSADIFLFDFLDDGAMDQAENFDPGSIGATVDALGSLSGNTLTLTLADIVGQDGVAASSGAPDSGHTANIAGNQDALSVNTDNTADDAFITGGGDSSHFNPVEALFFTFPVDVTLIDVELESFTPGAHVFEVATGGSATALADGNNSLSIAIPAGQPFSLEFVELLPGGTDVQIRVESFSVEIPHPVVVPEPSSIALLGLFGLGAVARRRK